MSIYDDGKKTINDFVNRYGEGMYNGGYEDGKTEMLSIIEDIKAEISQERDNNRNGEYDKIFELCLLIIDKHISGKEQA